MIPNDVHKARQDYLSAVGEERTRLFNKYKALVSSYSLDQNNAFVKVDGSFVKKMRAPQQIPVDQ